MVSLAQPRCKVLVVGFGNTLRRDDGVGCLIAQEVAAWQLPDVAVREEPLLTPDLTLALVDAETAFFIDARPDRPPSDVQVEYVEPLTEASPAMIHASTPQFLLGLCRAIFGRCPSSWLVSVPAADFEIGEGLSPFADSGKKQAILILKRLIAGALAEPSSRSSCQEGEA